MNDNNDEQKIMDEKVIATRREAEVLIEFVNSRKLEFSDFDSDQVLISALSQALGIKMAQFEYTLLIQNNREFDLDRFDKFIDIFCDASKETAFLLLDSLLDD